MTTTTLTATEREEVAVPELHHGDTIHLAPHAVYRHSGTPLAIACAEADVQVDWVCYREHVVVIVIWHIPACGGDCAQPEVCGSTAYDADDSVLREVAAA